MTRQLFKARRDQRAASPLRTLTADMERACVEQGKTPLYCRACGHMAFAVWRNEDTIALQCLVCGAIPHMRWEVR